MLRRLTRWSFISFSILCIVYASSLAMVYFYSFKNDTQKADAAIVLGAAAWGDHPSPVLKGRVEHGIWLYKEGYVKKIIFTGGKYNETTPSESSVAKNYAIKHGVKEEDIFIEEMSKATEQNMKFSKDIMEKEGIKSALIVSDPFHMSRSMTIASIEGIDAHTSPTPTSAYQSWDSKMPFLMHEAAFLSGYILTYPVRWFDWNFFENQQILLESVS